MDRFENSDWNTAVSENKKLIVGALVLGGGAFVASRVHISGPTEHFVRTGLGIRGLQVGKSFVRWPFQTITSISTTPVTHKWNFKCLSKQFLPFQLPTTCTTAPYSLDDMEGAKAYASTMSTLPEEEQMNIIQAVIHGEFRVRASTVDIDDLNDNREKFRDEVILKVSQALRPIGVSIVNANVAEIEEEKRAGTIGYLEAREKKKLSQAIAESEINISEAKKQQDIETTQLTTDTRRMVATLNREATLAENTQKQQIAESNAQLAVIQAESKKREMVAKIEAETSALLREQELQKAVEAAKQERELIRLRAEKLIQTQVEAEQMRITADAELYKTNQATEASLIVVKKRSEGEMYAMQQKAEGQFILTKKEVEGKALDYKTQADGTLQVALSEAQGIFEKLQAEGKGMRQVAEFTSNPDLIRLHMLLKTGTPIELARAHAESMKNMNPKIWNFTTSTPGTSTSIATVANDLMKMFPAGLQMLQDYNLLNSTSTSEPKPKPEPQFQPEPKPETK